MSREFGDLRNLDYDPEGHLIGVELIGLPGGVSLYTRLPDSFCASASHCSHMARTNLRIEG